MGLRESQRMRQVNAAAIHSELHIYIENQPHARSAWALLRLFSTRLGVLVPAALNDKMKFD